MRLAGTLPDSTATSRLSGRLLGLGILHKWDVGANGAELWIIDEDRLAEGTAELTSYLADPQDERFRAVPTPPPFQPTKRVVVATDPLSAVHGNLLTMLLVTLCVLLYVALQVPGDDPIDKLEQSARLNRLHYEIVDGEARAPFQSIRQGEVWRLVTPALMHLSFLHLVGNMLASINIGSWIENRRGPTVYLPAVMLLAIISNTAQYLYDYYVGRGPVAAGAFLGYSGVVCGLFGYGVMRWRLERRRDPYWSSFMNQQVAIFYLIWIAICMFGLVGPIANAAHLAGLASGALWGWFDSRWEGRAR